MSTNSQNATRLFDQVVSSAQLDEKTRELLRSEWNSRVKLLNAKDSNAPKRSRSAYNFFSKLTLEKLKTEKPDLKQKDAMGMVGKQWKELTDSEKVKYEKMAQEDLVRFQRESDSYTRTFETKTRKPTAYNLFVKENRNTVPPDVTGREVLKYLSKMWSDLSDEMKKKYDPSQSRDEPKKSEEKAPKKVTKKDEPKKSEGKAPKKVTKKDEPKKEVSKKTESKKVAVSDESDSDPYDLSDSD